VRLSRITAGRLVFAAILTALIVAFGAFANAGHWLLVDDPLQLSRAVVVFGGQVPFRAMEAAKIYKQGFAREVWLTEGGYTEEDAALEELGIERTPDHVYSRRVLEREGVPAEAIRILSGHNSNTADEVRLVSRQMQAAGGDRVILVTSKSHSRRVKVLWHSLAGDHHQASVRYATRDPFQPARWWLNTADAMSVSREWFGLLNAWVGFPVKSERR